MEEFTLEELNGTANNQDNEEFTLDELNGSGTDGEGPSISDRKWSDGDGGQSTLPEGKTNKWGGNLRNEGRKPLIRRGEDGKAYEYSTTTSMIVGDGDGKYHVIPTVVDGEQLSKEDAVKRFVETGEKWGSADDEKSAAEIAKDVHDEHAKLNQKGWNEWIQDHWDEVGDEVKSDRDVSYEHKKRTAPEFITLADRLSVGDVDEQMAEKANRKNYEDKYAAGPGGIPYKVGRREIRTYDESAKKEDLAELAIEAGVPDWQVERIKGMGGSYDEMKDRISKAASFVSAKGSGSEDEGGAAKSQERGMKYTKNLLSIPVRLYGDLVGSIFNFSGTMLGGDQDIARPKMVDSPYAKNEGESFESWYDRVSPKDRMNGESPSDHKRRLMARRSDESIARAKDFFEMMAPIAGKEDMHPTFSVMNEENDKSDRGVIRGLGDKLLHIGADLRSDLEENFAVGQTGNALVDWVSGAALGIGKFAKAGPFMIPFSAADSYQNTKENALRNGLGEGKAHDLGLYSAFADGAMTAAFYLAPFRRWMNKKNIAPVQNVSSASYSDMAGAMGKYFAKKEMIGQGVAAVEAGGIMAAQGGIDEATNQLSSGKDINVGDIAISSVKGGAEGLAIGAAMGGAHMLGAWSRGVDTYNGLVRDLIKTPQGMVRIAEFNPEGTAAMLEKAEKGHAVSVYDLDAAGLPPMSMAERVRYIKALQSLGMTSARIRGRNGLGGGDSPHPASPVDNAPTGGSPSPEVSSPAPEVSAPTADVPVTAPITPSPTEVLANRISSTFGIAPARFTPPVGADGNAAFTEMSYRDKVTGKDGVAKIAHDPNTGISVMSVDDGSYIVYDAEGNSDGAKTVDEAVEKANQFALMNQYDSEMRKLKSESIVGKIQQIAPDRKIGVFNTMDEALSAVRSSAENGDDLGIKNLPAFVDPKNGFRSNSEAFTTPDGTTVFVLDNIEDGYRVDEILGHQPQQGGIEFITPDGIAPVSTESDSGADSSFNAVDTALKSISDEVMNVKTEDDRKELLSYVDEVQRMFPESEAIKQIADLVRKTTIVNTGAKEEPKQETVKQDESVNSTAEVKDDGIPKVQSEDPPTKIVGYKRNGKPKLAPEGNVGDKVRTSDGTVYRIRKSKESDNLKWVGWETKDGVKLGDHFSADAVKNGEVKGNYETIGELGNDQDWAVTKIGRGGSITLSPAKSIEAIKANEVQKPMFSVNNAAERLGQYRSYLNDPKHTEASLKNAIREVSSHSRQKGASLYQKSYHDAVREMLKDAERRVGELKAKFDRENADRLRGHSAERSVFGNIGKFVNDPEYGLQHPYLSLRFNGESGLVTRDHMEFVPVVDDNGMFVGVGSDVFNALFDGKNGAERNEMMKLLFGTTETIKGSTNNFNDTVVERYQESLNDDSLTINDIVDNIISDFDDYKQWVSEGAKTSEDEHYEELERRERGIEQDEENYLQLRASDKETYDAMRWSDNGGVVNSDGTAYNVEQLANGDIMLTDRDSGDVFVVDGNEPRYEEVWSEREAAVEPRGSGTPSGGGAGVRTEERPEGREGRGVVSANSGEGLLSRDGSTPGRTAKDRKYEGLTEDQKAKRARIAKAYKVLSGKGEQSEEDIKDAMKLLDEGVSASAIDASLFDKDDVAAWPVDGLKIETVEDVAHLGQMLSNPYFEITKYLYVDGNGVVVGHHIASLGLIGNAKLSADTILEHAPKEAKGVIISHNHPSGNVTPSPQDIVVTSEVKKDLKGKLEYIDHVITDTNKFSSLSSDWAEAMMRANSQIDIVGTSDEGLALKGGEGNIKQPVDLYNLVDYGERVDMQKGDWNNDILPRIAGRLGTHDKGSSYIGCTARNLSLTGIVKIPSGLDAEGYAKFLKDNLRQGRRFVLFAGENEFDKDAFWNGMKLSVAGEKRPENPVLAAIYSVSGDKMLSRVVDDGNGVLGEFLGNDIFLKSQKEESVPAQETTEPVAAKEAQDGETPAQKEVREFFDGLADTDGVSFTREGDMVWLHGYNPKKVNKDAIKAKGFRWGGGRRDGYKAFGISYGAIPETSKIIDKIDGSEGATKRALEADQKAYEEKHLKSKEEKAAERKAASDAVAEKRRESYKMTEEQVQADVASLDGLDLDGMLNESESNIVSMSWDGGSELRGIDDDIADDGIIHEDEKQIARPTTVLDKVFQVGMRQASNYLQNGIGTSFADFVKHADKVFGSNAPKLRKFYPTWYAEAGLDVSEDIRANMDSPAEVDRQTREMFGLPARGKDKPGARVAYVVQEHLVPKPAEVVNESSYNRGLDADQRTGVNLAISAVSKDGGSFMLADGTGFGKTRQILAIADQFKKANPSSRILIITKNQGIIADSFAKDSKAMGINTDRFTIGTYDGMRAGKFAPVDGDLFSDAGRWDLVLLDEAHLLSNSESGRAKAFADMNVDHVVFATATPMDRPTDAAYFMSRLVGTDMNSLARSLGYTIEKIRGADGKERDVAYPVSGADMESIKRAIISERDKAIAAGKMIRRAYPFLGDIDTNHRVEMSEDHTANENDIIRFYDNEVRKLRNAKKLYIRGRNGAPGKTYFKGGVPRGAFGIPVSPDRWPAIVEQKRAELLQDRTRAVDDINESEKAKTAAKLASEIIAKTPGARVIICGTQVNEHHVGGGFDTDEKAMDLKGYKKTLLKGKRVFDIPPSLDVAIKALNGNGITNISRIYGGFDKEQEQRDFVGGKNNVLVMTDKSGGTGINLDDTIGTHPTYLLVLSPNYSAKEIDQLMGRVSRKNTKSLSHVYFLENDSYSDAHRAKVTEKKLGVLKAIQGGADMDALGEMGKEGADGELAESEASHRGSVMSAARDIYLGRKSAEDGIIAEEEGDIIQKIKDDEGKVKATMLLANARRAERDVSVLKSAMMMTGITGVDEKLKAALTERGLVSRAFRGDEEARTILFNEWDGYKLDGIIRMKASENAMQLTPEEVADVASLVWFGDSSLVAHGTGLEPKFELNRNGVFTDFNRATDKLKAKYGKYKFITMLANKADKIIKDMRERKFGRTDGRTGEFRAPTGLQFTLNDQSKARDGSEVIDTLGSKASVDAYVLANQERQAARDQAAKAKFAEVAKRLPSRERSMLYAMLYAHIDVRAAEENSRISSGRKLSFTPPIGDAVARKAAKQLGYGYRTFKSNWDNILAMMRRPDFMERGKSQDSNFSKFTPTELINMMHDDGLDQMADIVQLREEGWGTAEIARRVGVSDGQVRQQISRAKKDWKYVEQLSLCDTAQGDLNFGVRLDNEVEEPASEEPKLGRFGKKSDFVQNQPSLFDVKPVTDRKTDFSGMRQIAMDMAGNDKEEISAKIAEQYPGASKSLVNMAVSQEEKSNSRPVVDSSGRKYASIEDMNKSIDVTRKDMASSISGMLDGNDITDARIIKDALKQMYPHVSEGEINRAYVDNVVPRRIGQLRSAIIENRYKVGSQKELVEVIKPMFEEMTKAAIDKAMVDTSTFDIFIRANREKEMVAYAKSIADVVNDPRAMSTELKIRYPGVSEDAIASVVRELGSSLRSMELQDTSGMSQGMLFEGEAKAKTGTKFNNDEIDAWRIARGMEAVSPRAKYTQEDMTRDVGRTLTNMAEARNQIDAMMKSGRFAADARQQGLIGAFIKTTQDQYDGLLSKRMAAENSGDNASADEFDRQMDALRPDLDRIHNLNKRVGKEWSDAGRARQMMLMDDYSFVHQRRKAIEAKGAPLTPEEESRLQALVRGVLGKNVELDAERMEQLELAVKSLVDAWMSKGISDVSVARLSRDERKIEREYAEALRQFDFHRDRLGGILVNLPNGKKWLNAVQRHYLFNGEAYDADGKPDEKKMVSLILRDLDDHGISATDWQVRQMITEMGHSTIPPQSKLEKDRRDLNAQHRIEQQIAYILKFDEMPPVTGYQRDEESQAVRMLKKTRSNLIKEKGLDAEKENGRLKSGLDRAKKTIRNKISDLEEAIRKNERIQKEKRTKNEDAELIDLRTQYKAVKDAYDNAFPPTWDEQLESAVSRTLGSLKRMRKFWQDRLDVAKATKDFDRAVGNGPTRDDVRAANPEVEKIEKEILSIREEFENLKNATFPEGTAKEIARREETRLIALDTKLKEYEKMAMDYELATTYSDKVSALKRGDKKDPFLTPRIAAKKAEVEREKAKVEAFRRELAKQNMQLGDRALMHAKDMMGAARLLRTSCDLGQVLIQGGLMSTRHPVMGVNAAIDAVKALSPRQNDLINQALKNDLYFDDFVNMGGHVYGGLDRAEQFRGMDDSVIMKVPGISHAIRASERSFSSYLNVFALAMYKNLVKGAWANGQPTESQRRQIAKAVNTALGYGYDSRGGAMDSVAGLMMFAPRLFVANAKMAFGIDTIKQLTGVGTGEGRAEYGRKDRMETAMKVASEHIGALVTAAALSAALMMLFDEDKDKMSKDWFGRHFVPGNQDFMKTNREGAFHISVGFQKVARFYNMVGGVVKRMMSNEDTQKKAGEKAVGRELRKTMSPVAGLAWDALSGEDFIGRKINWKNFSLYDPNDLRAESEKDADKRGISGLYHVIESLAIPLTFADFYEAVHLEGAKGFAYFPLIELGAQMTMYRDDHIKDAGYGSQEFRKRMNDAQTFEDTDKAKELASVGRERGKAMDMVRDVKKMETELNKLVKQDEEISRRVGDGTATEDLVKRQKNLKNAISRIRSRLLEFRPKADAEARKVNWKKSLD